jgi:hypothetical protein
MCHPCVIHIVSRNTRHATVHGHLETLLILYQQSQLVLETDPNKQEEHIEASFTPRSRGLAGLRLPPNFLQGPIQRAQLSCC